MKYFVKYVVTSQLTAKLVVPCKKMCHGTTVFLKEVNLKTPHNLTQYINIYKNKNFYYTYEYLCFKTNKKRLQNDEIFLEQKLICFICQIPIKIEVHINAIKNLVLSKL